MSGWLRGRVVFDRLAAAIILVGCAPIIGICGWLVRREDGGPWLIAVPRVGKNGRTISMWKLRTMRVETVDGRANGVSLTAGNDPRITAVGARLRGYYLDELPQLYNVVRGEMCLLGPRPEAPEFVEVASPHWQSVLAVPPGMAGPTQLVVGDWERTVITAAPDGEAYLRDVLPVKLAIDAWYVAEASARLDALVVISFLRRLAGVPVAKLIRRVTAEVPLAGRIGR